MLVQASGQEAAGTVRLSYPPDMLEVSPKRSGQWVGTFSGTNSGMLVLDLDELADRYRGIVSAYDQNPAYPRTIALIDLPKDDHKFSVQVPLQHVERATGKWLTQEEIAKIFPGVTVPTHAETEWHFENGNLSLKWTTTIGTNGTAHLEKADPERRSIIPLITGVGTWEEFKGYVSALEPYELTFRGHEKNTWRLRTSFHRSGRADLLRFLNQDVPALHRQLSGLTTHRFDLNDPNDYAAFLNLAQHHGYPTPMLDWTQSPFVAAYFAYKDVRTQHVEADQKIRILIFESRKWSDLFERSPVLLPGYRHITFLEPLAMNNPRAIPQQSLSAVTNVDDIEAYVADQEKSANTTFLRAIELPASDRRIVMQELALMGITAGSLFPGIDGACLQLKERFFDL